MCSLVLPFGGGAGWAESVTAQGHVDLVAVAAVTRDDVLQRAVAGTRDAAEDQQRSVDGGIEPPGDHTLEYVVSRYRGDRYQIHMSLGRDAVGPGNRTTGSPIPGGKTQ